MYLKIHKSYRSVVAICDNDLLGKLFFEGKRQLHVRESFYKDIEVTKEEAIKTILFQAREDSTFNIVGKESVAAALEAGIIDENSVFKVDNIPFALTLL